MSVRRSPRPSIQTIWSISWQIKAIMQQYFIIIKLHSIVSVLLWAGHMSDDRFLVSGECRLISFPRRFQTVTKAHPVSYPTSTPEGSSPEHAKAMAWSWRFSSKVDRVQKCMYLKLQLNIRLRGVVQRRIRRQIYLYLHLSSFWLTRISVPDPLTFSSEVWDVFSFTL
jgi:hypothetical protein